MALAETALAGGRRDRARARRRARDRRDRLRHRELRRRHGSPRCCGRPAPRSPASRSPRPRSPSPPGATLARSPSPAPRRTSAGASAPPWWMRARPRLRSRSPARRSSSGRPAATATSSCSRPRACRRSRSTGTRCSRPVLFWIGARPARLPARRPRPGPRPTGARAAALRPLAGELSSTVAATMGRQRRLLARALTLVALTVAFAGLDRGLQLHLRAAGGGRRPAHQRRRRHRHRVARRRASGRSEAAQLAARPRRRAVEPLQHRFAYVGADLQDLYGVRPATIGAAGQLQDAWFPGGSADQLMLDAGSKPDAILVSAETVKRLPAAPGRPAPPAPAGRADQAVHDRRRSTTRASPRSSRPRRATASWSPTPATSPARPAATPSARSSIQTDGTDPGDGRGARPLGGRHRRQGHRHHRPAAR